MEKVLCFVGEHEWYVMFGTVKTSKEQAERKRKDQIPNCCRGIVHCQQFKGKLSEKCGDDKEKSEYVERSKQNVIGKHRIDPRGDIQHP